MSTRELIESLPYVAGAIIAIGGIITGIMWLAKGYITKLHELHELKQEIEPLRAKAERARQLELERDEHIRRRELAENERNEERAKAGRATNIAKKNFDVATTNFKVCQRLKQEWGKAKDQARDAESRATESEESLAVASEHLDRHKKQIDDVVKQDGKVWCASIITNPPPFVPLAKRHQQRPMIVSVLNLKGGVGKTTLTGNLGGYLASCRKKEVLALDLDHQRSLTQTLFTTEERKDAARKGRTVQAVLRVDGSKPILEVAEQVQGIGLDRLWVVGNSDAAEEVYGETHNLDDREMALLAEWLLDPTKCDIRYLLRGQLHSSHKIQERFDYVLIDCPPRLTTACINALAASDLVLIPTQPNPVTATSVIHLLLRLRPLRDAGLLPNLQVLVVGNMISQVEDRRAKELKILKEYTAAALAQWKPGPIRLADSTFTDSAYYAKYQRDFVVKGEVQLPAVSVGAISDEYGSLTKEIERIEKSLRTVTEERIHEHCDPATVST